MFSEVVVSLFSGSLATGRRNVFWQPCEAFSHLQPSALYTYIKQKVPKP